MISIVKYETEEEAQQIIQEKSALGLILVTVQNITEGNFLGFTDDPNYQPRTPIEQDVNELKSQNADLIFAMVSNNLM